MGLFIAFEGGEGCGKSTQSKLLYERIIASGLSALLLHEPGGTFVGEEVRRILLAERGSGKKKSAHKKNATMNSLTELFLFSSARSELIEKVIIPNLDKDTIIICDRFIASTIAYQGYGRQIDLDIVKNIINFSTHGIKPDLTILLNIEPHNALKRVNSQLSLLDGITNTEAKDYPRLDQEGSRRFELESINFHKRVYQGYINMSNDNTWLTIDGGQSIDGIHDAIWANIQNRL
jgi:dTMP kinase